MMKFYIGQKVSFEMVGNRIGTIVGYHNGIWQIQSDGAVFGMKDEDLTGE